MMTMHSMHRTSMNVNTTPKTLDLNLLKGKSSVNATPKTHNLHMMHGEVSVNATPTTHNTYMMHAGPKATPAPDNLHSMHRNSKDVNTTPKTHNLHMMHGKASVSATPTTHPAYKTYMMHGKFSIKATAVPLPDNMHKMHAGPKTNSATDNLHHIKHGKAKINATLAPNTTHMMDVKPRGSSSLTNKNNIYKLTHGGHCLRQRAEDNLYITIQVLVCTYYLSMVYITADRFFGVLLNFKYKAYWCAEKTKTLLLGI